MKTTTKIPLNNPLVKRYNMLGCECKLINLKQSLRINTLKVDEKKIIDRLKSLNIKLTKIPFTTHGYYYESKFSLGATNEYLQGFYYLQEAASQLPAIVLDPKPGEIVLDMCAAPGSKTTQIGMYMNNSGILVALDSDPRRLLAVRNNLERCGVTNGILYKKDSRFVFDLGMQFDKILLDAPCTGNYAIEEDFFIKKSVHGIRERARLQRELLKAAIKVLKKDGALVYSTCSLEPEENEMNIDWVLSKYPEMKLVETNIDKSIGDPGITNVFGTKLNSDIKKTRRFWPEKTGTEGFYIAKLIKTK
ncbi:MAG TPA: RsmB/NOP family class I SAM-dependent RNA methyltransferase [Allocoleopsis sp.]